MVHPLMDSHLSVLWPGGQVQLRSPSIGLGGYQIKKQTKLPYNIEKKKEIHFGVCPVWSHLVCGPGKGPLCPRSKKGLGAWTALHS